MSRNGAVRLSYGARCAYCLETPDIVGPLTPYKLETGWLVLCGKDAREMAIPRWRRIYSWIVRWWKTRRHRKQLLTLGSR